VARLDAHRLGERDLNALAVRLLGVLVGVVVVSLAVFSIVSSSWPGPVSTSRTNQRRCHALVIAIDLLLSLFLKSQPALRVCLERSTAALTSASTGAWMQCTLSVERS